jgi:hypothetical protein
MIRAFFPVYTHYVTRVILLSFFLLQALSVYGQDTLFRASLDTTSIRIGEQATLTWELILKERTGFGFPYLPDTFNRIEVVSRSGIDTISDQNGARVIRQHFVITSFDSGYHVIPPFKVVSKTGTDYPVESNPLLLTVSSVDINIQQPIKDLKAQAEIPYTWRDFIPWFLGLLLLAGVILMIRKLLRRRVKGPVEAAPAPPLRPAHELALEKLEELEKMKLWQQGHFKKYHSIISDIIRNYIEDRWGLNAMEMTTDEILQLNKISNLPEAARQPLKSLLLLADLVKFAKWVPVSAENESALIHARMFIDHTMASNKESEVAS